MSGRVCSAGGVGVRGGGEGARRPEGGRGVGMVCWRLEGTFNWSRVTTVLGWLQPFADDWLTGRSRAEAAYLEEAPLQVGYRC